MGTQGRTVKLNTIESFLRRKLKQEIRKDLRELRIVKEADLECCVYYHLRRSILKDDRRWKILARKHVKQMGAYPDLLIFENATPRIAIELKWAKDHMPSKDLKSLRESLGLLGVNKAYFVVATDRQKSEYKPLDKTEADKYVLHEIVVTLDYDGERLRQWKSDRTRYMRKMEPRKN
jgi:hypothetical protein